jgi:hypothetical protein
MSTSSVSATPTRRSVRRNGRCRTVRRSKVRQGAGAVRTADDPLLLIYTGRKPLPGVPVDWLLRSWGAHAPPRFVRAVAAGRIVEGSPDRSRLLPKIYGQEWTGRDDRRHEIGGTLATLKRVLFPPFGAARGRAAQPWCSGLYWVAGRGHRREGRFFACPVEQLEDMKRELRDKCRAVSFVITHDVLKPDSPAEVLRTPPRSYTDGPILSTSPTPADCTPPWMIPTPAEGASSTRAPPDG